MIISFRKICGIIVANTIVDAVSRCRLHCARFSSSQRSIHYLAKRYLCLLIVLKRVPVGKAGNGTYVRFVELPVYRILKRKRKNWKGTNGLTAVSCHCSVVVCCTVVLDIPINVETEKQTADAARVIGTPGTP